MDSDVSFGIHTGIGGGLLTLAGFQLMLFGAFSTVSSDPVRGASDPFTTGSPNRGFTNRLRQSSTQLTLGRGVRPPRFFLAFDRVSAASARRVRRRLLSNSIHVCDYLGTECGNVITFFSGGITVVLSSQVVSRPFSFLCGLFGGISLLVLVSVFVYGLLVGGPSPVEPLGPGGIERWVVYPISIWLPAFGGYLLASSGDTVGDYPNRQTPE